jgi:hypothetical protein
MLAADFRKQSILGVLAEVQAKVASTVYYPYLSAIYLYMCSILTLFPLPLASIFLDCSDDFHNIRARLVNWIENDYRSAIEHPDERDRYPDGKSSL